MAQKKSTSLSTEKAKTYRIETDRLILRCYRLEDASMVSEAIGKSLDHLRPWMPWAKNHPEDSASTSALIKIGLRSIPLTTWNYKGQDPSHYRMALTLSACRRLKKEPPS